MIREENMVKKGRLGAGGGWRWEEVKDGGGGVYGSMPSPDLGE